MYPAFTPNVSARTIELDTSLRVRVAECGPRTGSPVVMLHGWAASLYTFRHALELLGGRGFRVIAPDLRGFGLSDRPTAPGAYRLEAYVGDLEALLRALGLDRAALAGHSMGGDIALHYALARPDRVSALALINPTGLVPTTPVLAVRALPRRVTEAIGERLVPRWVVRWILEHVAYGDASRVTPRDVDEYWAPASMPGYVRALRRTAAEFDWRPISDASARSLAVPTTVVLGTADRLVRNAKPAALRLAGAAVHEVSGGHCVHEERPGEVYDLIGTFLRTPG